MSKETHILVSRQPYLLAIALLTGSPILMITLPVPSIQPESPSKQSIAKPSLETIDIAPEFSKPSLETIDIAPEFSKPPTQPLTTLQSKYKANSGSELFEQRLAALKSGKIYPRADEKRIESSRIKAALKPTYEDWKTLLANEAKAIAQSQGTNHLNVLVGDSLSLWFPEENLPKTQLWLNQGISGDTTGGILKRLPAIAAIRPDKIYIMAGINDLRKGLSDEEILNNHRQIIRRLHNQHPSAEIIVQSILPTRFAAIPNSRIRNLNLTIATIAQQEKATYLDIHNAFIDILGNLQRELTTDGIHLSDRGYQVWQQLLFSQRPSAPPQRPSAFFN